jgi:hypothetical protein
LALNNRVSLLGSYSEFLWTPLPSPTFSLLTGQWLDFHQLADYHASRTAPQYATLLRRMDYALPSCSQMVLGLQALSDFPF